MKLKNQKRKVLLEKKIKELLEKYLTKDKINSYLKKYEYNLKEEKEKNVDDVSE